MNYIETIIDSSIAVIKICREQQLNALNKNVIKQLSKELDNLKLSNKVRVVIITGAGEKAFVAGADIKEFSNYNAEQGRELSSMGQKTLFDKIENFGLSAKELNSSLFILFIFLLYLILDNRRICSVKSYQFVLPSLVK